MFEYCSRLRERKSLNRNDYEQIDREIEPRGINIFNVGTIFFKLMNQSGCYQRFKVDFIKLHF